MLFYEWKVKARSLGKRDSWMVSHCESRNFCRRDNYPATRPGCSHERCRIVQVTGPKLMAGSPYSYRSIGLETQMSATHLFYLHIRKPDTDHLRTGVPENFSVPQIPRTKSYHAAISPGYQNEENLSPISTRQNNCGNYRLHVLFCRFHLFHRDTDPLLHRTVLLEETCNRLGQHTESYCRCLSGDRPEPANQIWVGLRWIPSANGLHDYGRSTGSIYR
jgi:hypothetical protein